MSEKLVLQSLGVWVPNRPGQGAHQSQQTFSLGLGSSFAQKQCTVGKQPGRVDN